MAADQRNAAGVRPAGRADVRAGPLKAEVNRALGNDCAKKQKGDCGANKALLQQ